MQNKKTGTLYVVATPMGNLKDMTLRAIEVLNNVDQIAAEDTRHAAQLLNHYSVVKPTISLHEFNERKQFLALLSILEQGESIALISDAGTPLICDPGYRLVKAASIHGIRVIPIPGPCAAIAALCVSGLPTDKFIFEGFLPPKQGGRKERLNALKYETRTMIFYEAPHRVCTVLQAMVEVFGAKRKAVVARELTKIYETVRAESLAELANWFESHPDENRGEIVILVSGAKAEENEHKEVIPEQVLDILLSELPLKQAARLASKITGERKNVMYELALTKKDQNLS